MSDFSKFTSTFRVEGIEKPKRSTTTSIKRNRGVLTCVPCRRSKLRCDRHRPCGTCKGRNEAGSCTYNHESSSNVRAIAADKLAHLESLVHTLIEESRSEESNDILPSSNDSHTPATTLSQHHDKPGAQQQPNGTQYLGSTHWSSVLEDIQDIKSALDGSSVDDEAPSATNSSQEQTEIIFGSPEQYSLGNILDEHFQSRTLIDRYIAPYFRGDTFIIPFIHATDFQRRYQEFLANPLNVEPLWLSILFSISFLGSSIRYPTDTTCRYLIENTDGDNSLLAAAGKCLVLGNYNRPRPFSIEALVLYAHCKGLTGLDPTRASGMILAVAVRLAYEMGYHRDPDGNKRFTIFEREMRRRTWAVCRQMDLMTSFQLGLPSNIVSENCDTRSPTNLLDSDFDTNTTELPVPRPETKLTRLLWFIVKDRLMPIFSQVCRNALSCSLQTPESVMSLDAQLHQLHLSVPEVLAYRPLSASILDEPFVIMTRLYVEFLHLKSFCILHRKHMARGSLFSVTSCIDAGSKIVSYFGSVCQEFGSGGLLAGYSWMVNHYSLNDFFLGTMVLCLAVHTWRKKMAIETAIGEDTKVKVLELLEQAYELCQQISPESKDARRVERAVRLTLDAGGGPGLNAFRQGSTPGENLQHPSPGMGNLNDTSQMNSLETLPGDWTAEVDFGNLDPFNFLASDDFGMDLDGIEFEM